MPEFPNPDWQRAQPGDLDMDPGAISRAHEWFVESLGDGSGRLVVVRHGRIVVEYNHKMPADDTPTIASAAKSIYSNLLGILVDEGNPKSADDLVVDYFPEMMDVAEGQGNRPGRRAFPPNRGITFRHLITNTSGYMKPGEEPGKVFNYQSWGMNILTHALATARGLYDVNDPDRLPGFQKLIHEKLAGPIGAQWTYAVGTPAFNDRLRPGARLDVFGGYTGIRTIALDFARVGWLWCNLGNWNGHQVVPESWMRETTVVAPDIRANCPEAEWQYGHGFWSNSEGKIWPDLPREAFTASGAGGHFETVFPSAQLVVVQNPGREHGGNRAIMANPEMLEILLGGCR